MSGIVMLAGPPFAGVAVAKSDPPTHTIEIRKMRFGPVRGNIKQGDRIVWNNRDIVAHTATARDGSFNVEMPSGGSATMIARKAGTIAFYCRYHPGMRGSLAISR